MRWHHVSLAAMLASLSLGCDALTVGPDIVISTDVTQYVPDPDGRVRVSFALTNEGDESGFIMSCGLGSGGDRFVWDVDRWQDDAWIVREERAVHVCPGTDPNVELGPGAVFSGTMTLLGDTGTYRLRVYYYGPSGEGEVHRTGPSNPFDIVASD